MRDPPRNLEKKFSEAIVQYYEKNYDGALKLINEILAKTENQKTLELKGLVLKASEKYQEAKVVYITIINKVAEAGLKPTEALGAYFDLAVVEFNFKNYDSSLKYFDFCIANNFNVGASVYFEALIYSAQNNNKKAVESFQAVLKSDALSLKPSAALYLSDLYSKQQVFDDAIIELAKAREYSNEYRSTLTEDTPEDLKKNLENIDTKINENIAAVNIPQYIKSVALILTYDSNVLSVPQSGSVADTFTGKSADKLTLKALFGHAGGYFDDRQDVWSYQFSGNVNSNRETETGQFLTNDFNYLWNIKPYADNFKSYRLSLSSIFQYQVNPTSNKGAFGPYSLAGTGVYTDTLKLNEVNSRSYDLSLKYEEFLQDPAFSIYMKKTGYEFAGNYTYAWDSKVGYLNPSAGAGLSTRYSNGLEYRNYMGQIFAADQIYFSEKHKGSLSASWAYADYYQRPGEIRKDIISNYAWDETYRYTDNLNFLLNLTYTINDSNIADIYKFNRYLISVGSSYNF
ncbi:MAG: hypothetical protein ACXVAX_06965 [Pseudobdellovibrio sp.]